VRFCLWGLSARTSPPGRGGDRSACPADHSGSLGHPQAVGNRTKRLCGLV